jgi:4-alpha-glucanotransferase
MSALHKLAQEAGLLIDWEDARGEPQRVSDETLVAILAALGLPAESERAIADSRDHLHEEEGEAGSSFRLADAGQRIELPPRFARAGRALLTLENGERREIEIADRLPPIDRPGYHQLEIDDTTITLAVAPQRGFEVADAAPGRRIWAPAVQIPSLRDRRNEPFGDFGALAHFAKAAAENGADALAISPVHALFPADPSRYSPYAPSTRLFLNGLLGDPSLLDGEEAGPSSSSDFIDWETAIPYRLGRLRRLYERRTESMREAMEAFRSAGGEDLELHARYDALFAHFFQADEGGGWQDWPSEFYDAKGSAAAAFARENKEEVDFYLFLQWLADKSLAEAQAAALGGGMALGLIADLAIGMDAGGSHAWSRRDALLTGLSVGAPPDKLGPDGQDWGITTFSPRALKRDGFRDFIATIRAALRHAGGIRIDHAMGLRRLWVVPHGASPTEGAYLAYPERDMMRLLALESRRARAVVVGEDLGTVPPGFREEMDERGFLGMRVLWFERDEDGGFEAPENWSSKAAALTSTHDLPTVAGWWSGRDIDWTWKIGRTSSFDREEAEREARAEDRKRLWRAFNTGGVVSSPQPAPDQPSRAVDAAVEYAGSTLCDIAIIPAEDLLALPEQPNLPGTIDEHPNWRRRLPGFVEEMLDDAGVRRRLGRLNRARRG